MTYPTPYLTEKELAAAQAAYAARPFAVRWIDSHYSGMQRFHTYDEAFDYVQAQWARQVKETAARKYCASCLRQSRLITPEGSISLRYLLLADDVSSY